MKNKILSIAITLTLLLPVTAWAVDDIVKPTENSISTESLSYNSEANSNEILEEETIETEPATINEQTANIPYKKPISKRKLVKKFLLAMFAVGLSSIALYAGLTLYNKIREGSPIQVRTPDGETPLSSPVDMETATKTFLEKTKWN
jgi:hypothetical protein